MQDCIDFYLSVNDAQYSDPLSGCSNVTIVYIFYSAVSFHILVPTSQYMLQIADNTECTITWPAT